MNIMLLSMPSSVVVVVLRALAVDRDHLSAGQIAATLAAPDIAGAGHQHQQSCVVASVHRNAFELLCGDDTADRGFLRLQHGCCGGDLDPLGDIADIQREIELEDCAGLEDYTRLDLGLKAGQAAADIVSAGDQRTDAISAGLVRCYLAAHAGGGVDCGDE